MNSELMFSNKRNDWETPDYIFKLLDSIYHFTLDPCASAENHKCNKYYTKEDNGLLQDWSGEVVFCNPPYGREISKWVKKAYEESRKEHTTVVLLIPARTDTKYFHRYILNKSDIVFIQGRIKFDNYKNAAPFPSMIVIFKLKSVPLYEIGGYKL